MRATDDGSRSRWSRNGELRPGHQGRWTSLPPAPEALARCPDSPASDEMRSQPDIRLPVAPGPGLYVE